MKLDLLDKFIQTVDKISQMIQTRGVWNIIFTIIIIYCIMNPNIILDRVETILNKIEERADKDHLKQLVTREQVNKSLTAEFESILSQTGFDRVLLLEMHNSGKNLVDLPFLKISGTLEVHNINSDVDYIIDEFKQASFGLYIKTLETIKSENYFLTYDLKSDKHLIDNYLYKQLVRYNINQLFLIPIYNSNHQIIAILGFSGTDSQIDKDKVLPTMVSLVQYISNLLEYANYSTTK